MFTKIGINKENWKNQINAYQSLKVGNEVNW